MNIEQIRDALPDYARDLKLNLGSVLTTAGAPGLTDKQIWSIALASAIAVAQRRLRAQHRSDSRSASRTRPMSQGAKAAAAIMGMNNIYYRFLHLVEDGEYQTMPARLRMNVIANHGIDKLDFELISLAVSAVNGCGLCITSHEKKLRAHECRARRSRARCASPRPSTPSPACWSSSRARRWRPALSSWLRNQSAVAPPTADNRAPGQPGAFSFGVRRGKSG